MTYALEIATSTPRAGRRFEPIQERELHQDALAAVQGLPGASRGLVLVPEFAGPLGIPDFTVYVGDIDRIRRRQHLDVGPVVNELETGIVSAAYTRRPSSAQDIARALGWPVETVAERLRSLVKRGALIETSSGKYVRPESLEPGGRLYAVEAKVEDWRSALRQVRTYRVWADSYVLVMGQLTERAQAAVTAEVMQDRGGLLLEGSWVVRPRLGHVAARRRTQAAELFAAATRAGLGSPALAPCVHS
ncbi:DNA-binding Lrp family transcriptional regulator [Arthrobacter sp. CAN_A214]